MAGYSSENNWEDRNDDDYYSDGSWGDEQDDGDYYYDDHHKQQDLDDYDSVDGELYFKEQDNDEIPYDHLEDLDNVTGSYEETDGEYAYYDEGDDNDERSYEGYNYEEQGDDYESDDESRGTFQSGGTKFEEFYDQPGDQVGRYEVPGNVTLNLGQNGPQQNMTRSTGKQSGVDEGRHPVTSYEWSSRTRHQDKKTGDYARETMKHTFASGDTFKERSTGRIGFKDEYKQSTTITIGNKGGYSEYCLEKRLRTVEFG